MKSNKIFRCMLISFVVLLLTVLLSACHGNQTQEPPTAPASDMVVPEAHTQHDYIEDPPVSNTFDEHAEYPHARSTTPSHGIDFDTAFSTFPPETVMFTAQDFSVTWAELFHHIHVSMVSLRTSMGGVPDLSHTLSSGVSIAQTILDNAVEEALRPLVYLYAASIFGVELSSAELKELDEAISEMAASLGGSDNLSDLLWTLNGIRDIDLFRHLIYLEYMQGAVLNSVLDELGRGLTEEEAAHQFYETISKLSENVIPVFTPEFNSIALEHMFQPCIHL